MIQTFLLHPRLVPLVTASALGDLPGVKVSRSNNVDVSALLADQYCGADAELIYYMKPGALLSRPFNSKDTHSPRGDLLVVYSDGHSAGYADRASTKASSGLLGFESPMFTFGTDLVLPSNVNEQLRDLLLKDDQSLRSASAGRWDDRERTLELLAEVDNIDAPEVSR